MPCGKCTITLQDVAVQLGLPMDGEPLTGSLRYNWKVIYEDFLGIVPRDMKGQRLSLPWLETQFEELFPDADVVSIQRYADTYTWGVVTLTWLYKELCRINWTPYTSDIMASLPLRCRSGQAVWTYVGPLICFHLVEKHQPDQAL
ncbi:serine/threonine-protein phosphatase 7 long form-like protein [Cucumis melo var. makuwa]|uniref:Serine/threonine-protein phosphatase 7 long form-like protein n=1 Tax=Cucumis melo var. makuwa TaxID=1194695 RepID=A0A5D3CKL2_CUCMM|nr:serine/threonine-protein phosphatase 7 long form-like protein [Cucumis melo var. makuwa]